MADAGTTTTYVGPTPGSGQYGIFQAQAENAYATATQKIGAQRTQFLGQQGLKGQYDASGNYTGFDFGTDPNGQYQMMNQGNALQGEADDAAIAGSGFKGGLANQLHGAAQQAYSHNASNWATNALSGLNDLSAQGVQAQTDYTNSLFDGLQTSIETAIQNGTYNPADYTGLSIDGQSVTPPPADPGLGGTGGPATGPWQPPTPTGGSKTWVVGGKTVYGFGPHGNPFYSAAAAKAAGRLGKGKGQ